MMRVPHNRLTHGNEEVDKVAALIAGGRWSSGYETEMLEYELSRYTRREFTTVVGSGLGAIRLALLSLDIGSGDEVIIPAYNCVALANAILACGAKPVVSDIKEKSWILNPDCVRSVVNSRSKAIILVHTFGYPADADSLRSLGVPLIEDCAHGLDNCEMGNTADIAVTSFYSTKLIGAGEGGAVMSNEKKIDKFVKQWRSYVDQSPSASRLNDKITELSAALARVQLERLPWMVKQRTALAERYSDKLALLFNENYLHPPLKKENRIWYRYCVEIVKSKAVYWKNALYDRGIDTELPIWDWRNSDCLYKNMKAPITDHAYDCILSLPLYPALTEEEQDKVIEEINDVANVLS